ncbi:MAG: hypothetical protein ACRCUE_16580 [Bosea sp. (in: a-proteobacteria)]
MIKLLRSIGDAVREAASGFSWLEADIASALGFRQRQFVAAFWQAAQKLALARLNRHMGNNWKG